MEISREVREVISRDPSLCNNWADAGLCYYPNGWRNFKGDKRKLQKCRCSWKGNILCKKCVPDKVLWEGSPRLFKKKND